MPQLLFRSQRLCRRAAPPDCSNKVEIYSSEAPPPFMRLPPLLLFLSCAVFFSDALAPPPQAAAHATSTWNCTTLNQSSISPDASWTRSECVGETPLGKVGPMTFNVVRADLTKGGLALLPAVASSSPPLQPLSSITAQHPRTLAAINGGYFWRVDDASFIDNVCWTKSKEQAEQPASPEHRSCGVGDSAVVINSTIIATNCEDPGYARPAALICDGTKSDVVVLHRGELLPHVLYVVLERC